MLNDTLLDDTIREKFTTPVIDLSGETTLEDEAYASNRELIRRNEIVIRLLSTVAEVVDKFKEYNNIKKLLGDCSPYVHMRVVGDHIREARNCLVHAQRAKTWEKSRHKRNYLSKDTLRKDIDKFNEHIDSAVMELKKDIDKRRGRYFANLKHSVFENLPESLKEGKRVTVKEAPVLVFVKPGYTIKGKNVEQVQDSLYLIHDAKMLGANRSMKVKLPFVQEYAQHHHGCTVYENALPRSTGSIDWYLLLDFNAEIASASFVSSMSIVGVGNVPGMDRDSMSLENWAWAVIRYREQRKRVATSVQRKLREDFEHEERDAFETLRYLSNLAEAYKEVEHYWEVEFGSLTSIDGSPESGLSVGEYAKIDMFFERYLQVRMAEYDATNETRKKILWERVEARKAYYSYLGVREKLREIRSQMKQIQRDIDERRAYTAQRFGIAGLTKLVDQQAAKERVSV